MDNVSTEFLIAVVTLVGVVVSSMVGALALVYSSRANKAVNGVGAGEPRIYDMVYDTHGRVKALEKWRHGYDNGPLDNGNKVKEFVQSVDDLGKVVRKLQVQGESFKRDIEQFGCPVRLKQADTPPDGCLRYKRSAPDEK